MSSSAGDNKKTPAFPVGAAAKRELRRALVRSTNPAETIQNFQQSHSLHTMFSVAFGTEPHYQQAISKQKSNKQNNDNSDKEPVKESLDTDSVLIFLSHLGVSQHEVHKRISDMLQKQLEDEIRKQQISNSNSQEALLNLLKNCWAYATTLVELRPILWAVLKQLGDQTPLPVLKALAERDTSNGTLKHSEIFGPLPQSLKRLVWEADWEEKIPIETEMTIQKPKEYLQLVQATLFAETVQPLVTQYTTTPALVDSAKLPFVSTARERRIATTQRRALVSATSTTSTTTTALLMGSSKASTSNNNKEDAAQQLLTSAKAVSQIRQILGAGAGSSSYRPKLLHAMLSMLIVQHGILAKKHSSLCSEQYLHCSLVADILLSAGGPLPKAYQHVLTLARVLDDAVKVGTITDLDLQKVQTTMTQIYEADPNEDDTPKESASASSNKKSKENDEDEDDDDDDDDDEEDDEGGKKKKKGKKKDKSSKNTDKKNETSTFLKRQLNRIIAAGINAMKESDPQNLFVHPVTDAIAPGYSKIIKKPMCMTTMEQKMEKMEYNHIIDWEADVKLMFKNCVDYNRGAAGQWFRGEAQRQSKVFKDEIYPQAKKLWQTEVAKRKKDDTTNNADNDKTKGAAAAGGGSGSGSVTSDAKRTLEAAKIGKAGSGAFLANKKIKLEPLPPCHKKRKQEAAKENQEQFPSMPALASMLLADPFVVRLLIDRVLRSLRIDVLRGTSLPTAHTVVPSLLQLLHIANWSTKVCAVRGARYIVPDAGQEVNEQEAEMSISFRSLRRYLPVLMHLLLEAELDKRLVKGGDLNAVAEELELARPTPPKILFEESDSGKIGKNKNPLLDQMQVPVSLLEGAFIHVCVPGNSQDVSLSLTFPRFSHALQQIAGANIRDERAFFSCLVPTILRYKTRLHKNVRDTILSTWLEWLQNTTSSSSSRKSSNNIGSMTSAAHEYFVYLLNEWASFGNLILPRDLLLKTMTEVVEAVNASEVLEERKFVNIYQATSTDGNINKDFEPIKQQYDRFLTALPENFRSQWKEQMGLAEATENNNNDDDDIAEKEDNGNEDDMDVEATGT